MKLCRDCKWGMPAVGFRERGGFLGFGSREVKLESWEPIFKWIGGYVQPPVVSPMCSHPMSANVVSGRPGKECCDMRKIGGKCGPTGDLFVNRTLTPVPSGDEGGV